VTVIEEADEPPVLNMVMELVSALEDYTSLGTNTKKGKHLLYCAPWGIQRTGPDSPIW
jgi:hypothetical protein